MAAQKAAVVTPRWVNFQPTKWVSFTPALTYAHPARLSWVIARRQTDLPKSACDIAWKAQLRLCARFRRLNARGVPRNKVVVAVARELCGFVWAIAREVKPTA